MPKLELSKPRDCNATKNKGPEKIRDNNVNFLFLLQSIVVLLHNVQWASCYIVVGSLLVKMKVSWCVFCLLLSLLNRFTFVSLWWSNCATTDWIHLQSKITTEPDRYHKKHNQQIGWHDTKQNPMDKEQIECKSVVHCQWWAYCSCYDGI